MRGRKNRDGNMAGGREYLQRGALGAEGLQERRGERGVATESAATRGEPVLGSGREAARREERASRGARRRLRGLGWTVEEGRRRRFTRQRRCPRRPTRMLAAQVNRKRSALVRKEAGRSQTDGASGGEGGGGRTDRAWPPSVPRAAGARRPCPLCSRAGPGCPGTAGYRRPGRRKGGRSPACARAGRAVVSAYAREVEIELKGPEEGGTDSVERARVAERRPGPERKRGENRRRAGHLGRQDGRDGRGRPVGGEDAEDPVLAGGSVRAVRFGRVGAERSA